MAFIDLYDDDNNVTRQVNPDELLDAARRSSQGYNNPDQAPPTEAPSPPDPYTNWDDERRWFNTTAVPHVKSKPFLYGRVADPELNNAFKIYNKYRNQFDRAGSYNRTLDDLGWWTGQVTSAPQTQTTAPETNTSTANLYGAPRYQGGGVNLQKWLDPSHSSSKYEVLRYLDQFDPMKLGRQGLLALAPDQRAGLEKLGYQVRDEDKIFRNDIGEIDVLHGKRDQYGWRLTGVGNQPPGKVRPKPLPKVSIIDRPPGWSGGGGINPPGRPNLPPGVSAGPGTGRGPGGYTPPGGPVPPSPNRAPDYQSQFTDPLTQQYEQMLEAQKRLYSQQQTAMEAEGQRQQGMYDALMQQYQQQLQFQTNLQQQQQMRMQLEQGNQAKTREQAEAARQRLTDYANQRIGKLQGPAYTGTEQEVIRTQYLDPIERDRAATRQRALQNVGSRGFDPSSGIAQDLFNQIDRGFDSQRAQAQGDIAYRQITEQRSREQEAEKLLQYLAALPNAAATGDLQLMQYLDQLITQPGMNTLGMTGQRAALPRQQADTASYFQGLPNMPGQQALATSALLADLPVQRTQLGIQALGLGGQPQSGVSGALRLLENAQYNRMFNQGQQADFWRNLGMGFL